MAPEKFAAASTTAAPNKKRKDPPKPSSNPQKPASKQRDSKRVKYDARSIQTKAVDPSLKNGELDLQSFLNTREFEIKALQDGMQKAKKSRSARAFQQVPRDMRRRTASHNVKRVPKRMQKRAEREMRDDNTPTVTPGKRKPGSSRGRLRVETAKRLEILAAKKRAMKEKKGNAVVEARLPRPKIRQNALNDPPKPKSKFRKRQIHKTWLPTHLWHAKRATMTEPKSPLWRFALPLTPTEKSYRPTHRAGGARGAVVWDMSYMSTIGLEGPEASIEKLLKAVGVTEQRLWEGMDTKWRHGKRSWSGWMSREAKENTIPIGPATIIWCPPQHPLSSDAPATESTKPARRRVLVRIHPSAFLETWAEMLRLSKLQRPVVHMEDLRFEIGSIDITGPASTETLLGILHPYDSASEHAKTFQSLAGITNPASLPPNSLLSFPIMDPRLRYPPRPVKLPNATDEEANFQLLQMLSSWPSDKTAGSPALFNRDARFKASRLPSQKALNRRKSLALPGEYAPLQDTDPEIPIILLASRSASSGSSQGTWTILAPWKCILPLWYGLMHYPLSSGGNPRLGGLQELRQLHFEKGTPWFPGDFPGTKAGFEWELEGRAKRKAEWEKRPKGKRTEYDSLNLGAGRKGEVGRGWACDFERLLGLFPLPTDDGATDTSQETPKSSTPETPFHHLPAHHFLSLLSSSSPPPPPPHTLATILITLTTRGVASPCARIYRLPRTSTTPPTESSDASTPSTSPSTTREAWLALLPPPSHSKLPHTRKTTSKPTGRIPLNTPLPQRVRLLAESLLQDPPMQYPGGESEEDGYPLVPDEEDCIGFVTSGEFNLAEGKGVAVGSVLVTKILEGMERDGKSGEGRLCIVRNSGEKVGRLARWEVV